MSFCKKCTPRVKDFFKKVDKFLIENTTIVISFVSKIKAALDNPAVDILTAIIPGEFDDKLKTALRVGLSLAVNKLVEFDKCNSGTDQERIICYLNYIKTLPTDLRDAQLFKLGALITKSIDGNRFKQYEYDTALQLSYSLHK
ncbi:MAG: hypothetical protein ACTHMM_13395 [Agriterribacter sp.]